MNHEKYFEELGRNKIKEFNFYSPKKCEARDLPLLIRYCPNLESIELPLGITQEQISLLKQLKNLHTISFEMVVALSDESLSEILALPNLRSLEIINNKIGVNFFQKLSICQHLISLDLSSSDYVTDKDLKTLTQLKNLEKLGLGSSDKLTDIGIQELTVFSKLKELDLGSCRNLTNQSLKTIGNLKQLEVLNLQRLAIDIEGLRYLNSLKELKVLNLRFCKNLDDEGMRIIGNLENLEQLAISNCWNVTEEGFENLIKCVHLTHLDVSRTQFSDKNLSSISGLSALGSLSLASCEKLYFPQNKSFEGFKNLIDLELAYNDSVNDDVLKSIAKLQSLQTLDISRCNQISDIGLESLSHSPALCHINLQYCQNISVRGLFALSKNLKTLSMIVIAKGKNISDQELDLFKRSNPQIELIH